MLAMIGKKENIVDSHASTTMPIQSLLKRVLECESGASAIEYGLILGMVSIGIIGALQGMALGVDAIWDTAKNGFSAAISP